MRDRPVGPRRIGLRARVVLAAAIGLIAGGAHAAEHPAHGPLTGPTRVTPTMESGTASASSVSVAGTVSAPDSPDAMGAAETSDATATRPALPPGWSCTGTICRPRAANPIRSAGAFGLVAVAAGLYARRRSARVR